MRVVPLPTLLRLREALLRAATREEAGVAYLFGQQGVAVSLGLQTVGLIEVLELQALLTLQELDSIRRVCCTNLSCIILPSPSLDQPAVGCLRGRHAQPPPDSQSASWGSVRADTTTSVKIMALKASKADEAASMLSWTLASTIADSPAAKATASEPGTALPIVAQEIDDDTEDQASSLITKGCVEALSEGSREREILSPGKMFAGRREATLTFYGGHDTTKDEGLLNWQRDAAHAPTREDLRSKTQNSGRFITKGVKMTADTGLSTSKYKPHMLSATALKGFPDQKRWPAQYRYVFDPTDPCTGLTVMLTSNETHVSRTLWFKQVSAGNDKNGDPILDEDGRRIQQVLKDPSTRRWKSVHGIGAPINWIVGAIPMSNRSVDFVAQLQLVWTGAESLLAQDNDTNDWVDDRKGSLSMFVDAQAITDPLDNRRLELLHPITVAHLLLKGTKIQIATYFPLCEDLVTVKRFMGSRLPLRFDSEDTFNMAETMQPYNINTITCRFRPTEMPAHQALHREASRRFVQAGIKCQKASNAAAVFGGSEMRELLTKLRKFHEVCKSLNRDTLIDTLQDLRSQSFDDFRFVRFMCQQQNLALPTTATEYLQSMCEGSPLVRSGVGINLWQDCHTVFLATPAVSEANEKQAYGRVVRAPQPFVAEIFKFYAEESIFGYRKAQKRDKYLVELATRASDPAMRRLIVKCLNLHQKNARKARTTPRTPNSWTVYRRRNNPRRQRRARRSRSRSERIHTQSAMFHIHVCNTNNQLPKWPLGLVWPCIQDELKRLGDDVEEWVAANSSLLETEDLALISECAPKVNALTAIGRSRASQIPRDATKSSFYDTSQGQKEHFIRTRPCERRLDEEQEFQWLHCEAARRFIDAIKGKRKGGQSLFAPSNAATDKYVYGVAEMRELCIIAGSTVAATFNQIFIQLKQDTLVDSLNRWRNKKLDAFALTRFICRATGTQVPTKASEYLEFLCRGSPTLRAVLTHITNGLITRDNGKLIIAEEIPLLAWYYSLVLNMGLWKTEVFHAGLSGSERDDLVKDFNTKGKGPQGLIMHYDVGCLGLNMERDCHEVITCTPAKNHGTAVQTYGPVTRTTQQNVVFITKLFVESSIFGYRESKKTDRFAEGVARRGRLKDCKIPRAGANSNHEKLPTTIRFQALQWPSEDSSKKEEKVNSVDCLFVKDLSTPTLSPVSSFSSVASPAPPDLGPENVEEKVGDVEEIPRGHYSDTTNQTHPLSIAYWIAPVDPKLRMLFSYFSEVIAPAMVVLDDSTNGYRSLVLPMALEDELLRRTVGIVAAQHLSRQRPELKDAAEAGRAAVISRLHKDSLRQSADKVFNHFTWATLIVLLVGETVTGSADYRFFVQMLLSLSASNSGQDLDPVLTSFLQAQTQMFELLGVPLLGEEVGVLTLMKASESLITFLSYSHLPQDSEDQRVTDLVRQSFVTACNIYTRCAANADANSDFHDAIQAHSIQQLIETVSEISPHAHGAHALVWVCFVAGAAATDQNQRDFFVHRMEQVYARTQFRNIPTAIKSLHKIWSQSSRQRWTTCLSHLSNVLVM
ncbi:hypothetical protein OPT61_g3203 [Boeremia exigua]|uniref:Uncharacterized protein n=1 Tax=Boeremia exigua TaxID=749465 RepID=A0ACC2IIZ7_9PLEO|nr:hypothetical protein OPT61_g3203 [Boeremia exigua]